MSLDAARPTSRRYGSICSAAWPNFALAAFAPSDTRIQVEERRGRTLSLGGVQISGEVLLRNLSDQEIVERVHRAQHDWLPKVLFALVPVWAFLVKLVTWREHRNFRNTSISRCTCWA